jgi:hypothetical protein
MRIVGTVLAGAQLAREYAKTIFANVHVGAELPGLRRIHVRNEHLARRKLVDDIPLRAVIVITDQGQYRADARLQAHMEGPIVPAHLTAIHRHVRPLRR